jgi:hypothetical protein
MYRAAALALVLVGCSVGPYWVRAHAPVAVTRIAIVDVPCGRANWLGCSTRRTGAIELKRGMPPALHACVLSHELHELDGYSHEHITTGVVGRTVDCGDGTIYSER